MTQIVAAFLLVSSFALGIHKIRPDGSIDLVKCEEVGRGGVVKSSAVCR
jgi:hypothetical protein